ncbi:MAG: actin, cytoplasmic 2 [Candidatus Hermodarchaeota archaeon]
MTVVIDNGSGFSKIGFAGKDQPLSVFPTLIGYPNPSTFMFTFKSVPKEYYIGKEAINLYDDLKIIAPLECGRVSDWDALEKIWHHIFINDLQINPSEHPVFLTESYPIISLRERERIAEIMFETFSVPGLYIVNQELLALYGAGQATGLVVGLGDGSTNIVPIIEGFVHAFSTRTMNATGRDITDYLGHLLNKKGYNFSEAAGYGILREIKEQLCYLTLDPEKERRIMGKNPGMDRVYPLQSGEPLLIGFERFLAPEVLFNPTLIGRDDPPLDVGIHNAIQSCDIDMRQELYSNIILVGGSSLILGLKERLDLELRRHVPEGYEVRIITPPERQYIAWIGGSILGSLNNFVRLMIQRTEYQEQGPSVIRRIT